MNLDEELQTLQGFEEYLREQAGRREAGLARTDCHCPLARYLKTLLPDEPIKVASDGIAIGDGRADHSPLTQEFIRRIDDGRHKGQPVSPAAATSALKQARKAIEVNHQGAAS